MIISLERSETKLHSKNVKGKKILQFFCTSSVFIKSILLLAAKQIKCIFNKVLVLSNDALRKKIEC